MKTYIVHTGSITSKLAVGIVFAACEQSYCFSGIRQPVSSSEELIGSPLSFVPERGDTIHFIDYPVGEDMAKYLRGLGVSFHMVGRHTDTYEHFGVKSKTGTGVVEGISTPMLAWMMHHSNVSQKTPPPAIAMLDQDILRCQETSPLLRYYRYRLKRGEYDAALLYREMLEKEIINVGWELLRDDVYEIDLFCQCDWAKKTNLAETKFLPTEDNAIAMQYPDNLSDEKVAEVARRMQAQLCISWIIAGSTVQFIIYSFGKTNAVEFSEAYYATGTPQEAGFTLGLKPGLELIRVLLQSKK